MGSHTMLCKVCLFILGQKRSQVFETRMFIYFHHSNPSAFISCWVANTDAALSQ